MSNPIKEAYYDAHANLLSSANRHTDDTFYAHVLSYLKVNLGESEDLSCGIKFDKGQYQMTVHPGFLKLTPKEREFRLKEQALHVLCKHLPRQGLKDENLWKKASDLSIHQLIQNATPDEHALFPKKFNFDEKQSAEVYYSMLKDMQGDEQSDGEGEGQGEGQGQSGGGDDHSSWKDSSDGLSQEEMEAIADEVADMIRDNAINKSRGDMTADLSEMLNLYKTQRKVKWKKHVKMSLNKKSKGRKSTWKKVNRRFPDDLMIKGYTRKFSSNVTIAVDVSGSMSNKEVADGLAEVMHLCKQMSCKPSLIQIDTEIKSVERFEPNKMKFGRKGMGGTYMWDGMRFIMENPKLNPDTVILITDGMIEDEWPETPPFKVIFLIVGKGNTLALDTSNINCKVFNISD